MRTLHFEDFAGSKKVQECGLLALGYALESMLRFEQPDSSTMSDLMRVEEALRLRCRLHIHLCSRIEVY